MFSDTAYHKERLHYTDMIYDDPAMLPRRYVLILTNLCNLECPFCFQSKIRYKNAMTTSDWIRLIDQLPQYASVTLTGGEPLVFRGWRSVLEKAAESYSCNIISNGLGLNTSNIEFMLGFNNLKVLSISIDDIGNLLRGVAPLRWKRVESMLVRFVQLRNQVGRETVLDAKTTVLDENVDSLLDIHRYCMERLKCDTHCFQFLKGSPLQHADVMYPMEAIFSKSESSAYKNWARICIQMELIRQYNLKNGTVCYTHPKLFDLNGADPIDIDRASFFNQGSFCCENYQPCKAPWESVHVNVDGHLFPCMSVSMGNVKEQSLIDIVFGSKFSKFKKIIRRHGVVEGCNRCGYLRPKDELFA